MEKIFVWMIDPEKIIYWDTVEDRLCLTKDNLIKAVLSEDQIGYDYETAQSNIANWAIENGMTNPDADRMGDYGRKAAWRLEG